VKKVLKFPALAVDSETKIHILGDPRAGNCFPARFLIDLAKLANDDSFESFAGDPGA
jgi:hypothetical protein